ncbi:OmpA family protein [Reyranella sp.]|uniref:OmpA family protein n=1 Tax=Reyranella sp. TaxID=1929291 RepID=UPI0011FE330C|nr:OmpA family protein [Reyranella sp.]TAJ85896.1 MAG: OmpA family protein [Reyranella sp.]
MKRLGALVAAGTLFAALPSFAQTVGTCPRGGGSSQPQPVRILFDLGSSHIRPAEKPVIAQAVKTAKDRQVSAICLIGHTDKLGDKAYNEKLSRARAQAVAAEMVHAGYPGKDITIVADPEAFGNMSLGKENASEIDRKVTIFYAR